MKKSLIFLFVLALVFVLLACSEQEESNITSNVSSPSEESDIDETSAEESILEESVPDDNSEEESISVESLPNENSEDESIPEEDIENDASHVFEFELGEKINFGAIYYDDVPDVENHMLEYDKKLNEHITDENRHSDMPIILVESYDELNVVYDLMFANKHINHNDKFEYPLEDYKEGFFKENNLIIIGGICTSSATDSFVGTVTKTDDSLYLVVCFDSPESVSDDEICWVLTVSVSKSDMADVEYIYAKNEIFLNKK